MNVNKLLKLIAKAKGEWASYCEPRIKTRALSNIECALDLMQKEIKNNTGDPLEMNDRVFRGFRDVCAMAVKSFEDTDLERALLALSRALENEIPEFKNLGPLRMDFGKQDPI